MVNAYFQPKFAVIIPNTVNNSPIPIGFIKSAHSKLNRNWIDKIPIDAKKSFKCNLKRIPAKLNSLNFNSGFSKSSIVPDANMKVANRVRHSAFKSNA